MPGHCDGWGVFGTDFIYNMDSYIDYVNDNAKSKRGGPYFPDADQQKILLGFMDLVMVSDEDFDAGTGFMQLYDLKGECENYYATL